MKMCEICGKDISDRRGRARFCIECAERRIAERNEAKRKTKVCEMCGAPLDYKLRKYCSKCAKTLRKRDIPDKVIHCRLCGEVIEGRSHNAKYCLECAAIAARAGNSFNRALILKKELEAKAKEAQYGDKTQCRTCKYYNRYVKCCDYSSITGVLRQCEPSPKCKKYEYGERDEKGIPFSLREEMRNEAGLFS